MKHRRSAGSPPRLKRSLIAQTSGSLRLQRRLDRSERQLATLGAYSRLVIDADSDDDVLAALTGSLVPLFADWAVAAFAHSEESTESTRTASIQATDPEVARRLADDLAVSDSELAQLLVDVRERAGSVPVADLPSTDVLCEPINRPYMAAPLIVDGVVLGACVAGIDGDASPLDLADCRFVHDLARRGSLAITWIRRRHATHDELLDHRRIETALRESEERFRTLANAGPVLIRQDDEEGNADYFNRPWLAFTGRSIEEQAGERWLEVVHPNDVAAVKTSMESIRVAHEEIALEYRLRRFDGEYCWMSDRGAPRFASDGRFLGYIWSALDISDQKRAESGLRLLATTGVVITSSLDLGDMLERFALLVTEAFANACIVTHVEGDSAREIAYASSRQDEPDDIGEYTRQAIERILKKMETAEPDPHADGTNRHVEHLVTDRVADHDLRELLVRADITSLIVARMDARGRSSGAMAFCTRSVAGRVYDEQDLVLARTLARRVAVMVDNAQLYASVHAAEERYRRLFESAADAMVAFDRSLVIREINVALADLVQRAGRNLVNRPISQLVASPSDDWDAIFAALQNGEWRGQLSLIRRDRETVPVEAWITRTAMSEGTIFIAAMRDVTARVSLESTRRQLLATISHDLKNPINSIKANAQLALRQLRRSDTIDREKVADAFTRIDGLTNKMVRQIDGLMDIALLEAGTELELRPDEVDLGTMTRLIVDQYRATTNIHDLSISEPDVPVVGFWDGYRLERVVTNLLTNAIKYSPEGGPIAISVSESREHGERWARLTIRDEGIGIPASDLPHILSRFGRGQNVLARIAGTGIGLVGANQIVTQHGGTIEVESTEGVGSVFVIRLPIR